MLINGYHEAVGSNQKASAVSVQDVWDLQGLWMAAKQQWSCHSFIGFHEMASWGIDNKNEFVYLIFQKGESIN